MAGVLPDAALTVERALRPLVATCLLPLLACASSRLATAPPAVEWATYGPADSPLRYVLALPQGHPEDGPVAVYLEGDGVVCQGFSASRWERFVTRRSGTAALVWAESRANAECATTAWRESDLQARQDELAALVQAVRLRRPRGPLFLVGSSAGATLAALHAAAHPGEIAGIVNMGGGLRPLSEVLPGVEDELLRRRRISKEEHAANLRAIDEAAARVRASPESRELLWGRSLRFWKQLLDAPVARAWREVRCPVLVVHGTEDAESVPFALVARSREELRAEGVDHVTFEFLEGRGHDLLDLDVWRRVDRWIAGQAR